MIRTQAFREQSQQARPCREDYLFDEKPKGNFLPLAFLTVLTGFAVYLRSFLTAAHDSQPRQESNRAQSRDDGSSAGQALREEGPAMEAPAEEAAQVEATGSADDPAQAKAQRASSREWLDEFVADGAPARTNSQSFAGTGRGSGPRPPANDNQEAIRPLPSEAADAIRTGGGGGGGGGGDDTPVLSNARDMGARGVEPGAALPVPGIEPVAPRPPRDDPGPQDRNRLPRTNGPVILPDLIACHAYFIPVLALLAGASDPDGDSLKVLALTSTSGKLTPVDGGWMFAPERGELRDVVFKYAISDGIGQVEQVAQVRIVDAPPIVGTDGDDNLLGTTCGDVIDAGAGDDNIDARQGNDVVIAGDGNDHIVAGEGHDIVFAGPGADIVFAGAGDDIVHGGDGDDRLFGEAGDDTLLGGDGDDLIVGGDGKDVLLGGAGNDTIQGDAGDDTLDGGAGDDSLQGGDGNDRLLGGEGNDIIGGDDGDDVVLADAGDDRVEGGAGDDVLADGLGSDVVDGGAGDDHVIAAAEAETDSYDGGDGEDALDYSSAFLDVYVDIGQGTAEGGDIGRDFIANFERIIGGRGDDHFVGGEGPISMTGGDGDDTFEFERSDDNHQPDLVRKITDFTYGDRIIAARYEIYYRTEEGAPAELSDLFDDIYLSGNSDRRPIRFRFEKVDGSDLTFVDVHDRDDSDEYYSIELPGRHELEFTVVVS